MEPKNVHFGKTHFKDPKNNYVDKNQNFVLSLYSSILYLKNWLVLIKVFLFLINILDPKNIIFASENGQKNQTSESREIKREYKTFPGKSSTNPMLTIFLYEEIQQKIEIKRNSKQ